MKCTKEQSRLRVVMFNNCYGPHLTVHNILIYAGIEINEENIIRCKKITINGKDTKMLRRMSGPERCVREVLSQFATADTSLRVTRLKYKTVRNEIIIVALFV